MNYVSAVYAAVVIIIAVDWLARGRKSFRGVGERKSDVTQVIEGVRHGSVGGHDGVTYT